MIDSLAEKRGFQRVPDFPGAGGAASPQLSQMSHAGVLGAGPVQNMQSWLRLLQLQGTLAFTSTF